ERRSRGRIYPDCYDKREAAVDCRQPKDRECSGYSSRCVSTSDVKVSREAKEARARRQRNRQNGKVGWIWPKVAELNQVHNVLACKHGFRSYGEFNGEVTNGRRWWIAQRKRDCLSVSQTEWGGLR